MSDGSNRHGLGSAPAREQVAEICADARRIFEQVLRTTPVNRGAAGGNLVRGTCLFGCILLKESLERFGRCAVSICGGDGAEDGGIRDVHGSPHGHYWLEGTAPGGEPFLADITADQFGYQPVVILWGDQSWAAYQAGDTATVQEHVQDLVREFSLRS